MKKMRKKFVFFAKVCMRLAIYVAFYALIASLKDKEKNICNILLGGWFLSAFHFKLQLKRIFC